MKTSLTSGAGLYVLTWVVLLGLTGTSFLTARLDLGAYATILALGIAVVKAGLVAAIFMHLRHTGGAARLAFSISIVFVLLLCGLVFLDVGFRRTFPSARYPKAGVAVPP